MSASEYVLLIHLFDEQIQKKGDPVEYRRHRRGAVLTLDSVEAARLLKAKAIAPHVDESESAEGEQPSGADSADSRPSAERPAQTALKTVWDQYGIDNGLDESAVKSMQKAEIAAAVDELDAQK